MAVKRYTYCPQVKSDQLISFLPVGAIIVVGEPTNAELLVVEIEETQKDDLDAAMENRGWFFVVELSTDTNPGSSRNYGVRSNDPTEPAPSVGDTYHHITDGPMFFNGTIWVSAGSTGGGSGSLVVTLSSQADPWVDTNSMTYAVMSKFRFAGTDKLGTAIKIFANAWRVSGAGTGDVRIFDATNGNPIAEIIGISSTVDTNLVDLGALSALPAAAAVFEIQGRRAGGGTALAVSTINVEF